ncbi:MAG TPA: tetratricopeptide repeat protein [Candidatus Polarisedimenticolia bacterium]|jgi:tetratricopeptide (TPR) repeat protein|nr:tetratricopeptide repeat protein [Candidatus Polarisedimenticolia bacterium]
MPSRRLLFFVGLAVAAAYAGLSFRSLRSPGRFFVVDAPLLGVAPRLVEPGWRFVPRLLARVSEYPSGPVKLRVDLSGDQALKSREGAKVEVEAELAYRVAADRVLDLHRLRGPRYETSWLAGTLRRRTAERVAAVSYDLVRNRDPELAGGVRGALKAAVSKEGLQIDGLRIFQTAGVGEASGTILRVAAAPLRRKVVVIGVDSFDWRIIDPLIAQGRMPNLAQLVARGVRANLRTLRPILSPVIWTSIATGMKPARHGIVDFVVTARDTGELVPVTSAMRQVPALWTLLSRQGIDVTVVAWWATWPAETVRGSIITDRIAFQLFEDARQDDWKSADPAKNRGKTYPPGLMDEVRPLIKAPGEVTDGEVAAFLPRRTLPPSLTPEQKDLLNRFRTVLAAGATYHAVALQRLREAGTPLTMIYYEGPDTTAHLFMKYRPPLLAGTRRADLELFGAIVDRYYELQDRYIGEILAAAGAEADVLLVSDHGFKAGSDRPPDSDSTIEKGQAAEWHAPIGVLAMAGPDVRRGSSLAAASVLDVAPTVLALFGLPAARDMDGQPLTEAFEPAFLERHPVAWIDSYGGARSAPSASTPAASAGDAALIEKLRSLGYIGEDRLTAHNNRGIMAMDEGDVDAAVADFEKALASVGGDAGGMIRANLARAWMKKGDLAQARRYVDQALAEDPRNKSAIVMLAGILSKQGDEAGAERELRRAIALDPTLTLAHSMLGELLQRRGSLDAALAEFRKVVEIAPLSPVEFNSIGNIHRKRGEVDRAMEAYREALRCDAQYVGAYNNLGLCLQEKGRLDEAKALYEKALAIRPENPILRNSLGTLLALQKDKSAAIAEFERAVKADPDWPVAQGNLATLLFETGRFAEARPAFERWIVVEPASVEPRLGIALTDLMLQRREPAVQEFEEVLRLEPGNLRAHIALGETFLKMGSLAQAQTHLERAAALRKDIPQVYKSLGEVYMKRGFKQQAAQAFRHSLSLEPGQDEVRRLLASLGG